MTQERSVREEILLLEERLRQAELGPDPVFFDEVLRDDTVFMSDGEVRFAKAQVMAAHQPTAEAKFTHVEMRTMQIVEHDPVVIVTCEGTFSTTEHTVTLKFMRVWLQENGRWQIVAVTISR